MHMCEHDVIFKNTNIQYTEGEIKAYDEKKKFSSYEVWNIRQCTFGGNKLMQVATIGEKRRMKVDLEEINRWEKVNKRCPRTMKPVSKGKWKMT